MAKLIFKQGFINDAKRHLREMIHQFNLEKVNLPRYKCRCVPYNLCPFCKNKRSLSYKEALAIYNVKRLNIGLQVPQCHICAKFETDDNPLFAYSFLERDGEFRFIYRCRNGHSHDYGMVYIDIHTGLEVYC